MPKLTHFTVKTVKMELLPNLLNFCIRNIDTKSWLGSVPLHYEFGPSSIVDGWVYTDQKSCKEFIPQLTECTNTMIIGDWS